MTDLKKRKLKHQQMNDARKARKGKLLSQKNLQADDEDDDGSGGGPGKRKQNGFKLEKLLGAIAEGRQKAKGFWRALAKEGLDISDTKKSELHKQKEKTSKISEKVEKAASADSTEATEKEAKKAKERALDERESKIDDKELRPDKSEDAKPAWEKAKASGDASNHRFGLDKSSTTVDAIRRSDNNAKTQGSLFAKQEQAAGAISAQVAQQTSADRHGARVQGASYAQHQDYHGTMQFNHSGKNSSEFAFSKGVKVGANAASSKAQAKSSNTTEKRQAMRSAR